MTATWWERPLLAGHRSVFPDPRLVEVIARAFSVVEVGGFDESGPARGRTFERVFRFLCERRGVRLSETAGAKTLAGRRSASRLPHEVDAASRSAAYVTHWELKHLTSPVHKNELLIFNSKGLDFLQGSDVHMAGVPVQRVLLSGGPVRNECRLFAVLWGIITIEPDLLPLPLICEAMARGGTEVLRPADIDVIRYRATWACRPLQSVLRELLQWTAGEATFPRLGPSATLLAKEILDVQEQLGRDLLDWLDDIQSDWIDATAEDTWHLVGGW